MFHWKEILGVMFLVSLVIQLSASNWRDQLLAWQPDGGPKMDRLHHQGGGGQGDQAYEGAKQSTGKLNSYCSSGIVLSIFARSPV